ncbi:two-component system sensor histidine kinase YesM [Melghirimyces profundicolus]|uniref:histidine kinase n=1 Tax=Melghirimyces profundicolus TaxID=1242148 RepID=A0A2T6BZ49_9BACL|nr:sensor histidine kinase [Melghirimyces profundicolus]PTX61326.1 two-component system sensor histidine kinase YesM [Melghirimyces profundicolus]
MGIYTLFKNRIAVKMVVAFLLVILLPTSFTSILFYVTSSNIVNQNVRESSVQIAEQSAQNLSNIVQIGNDTSNLVYSNMKIQQAVLDDSKDGIGLDEREENNQYVTEFLNQVMYANSMVKIIYVFKPEGTSWGSGTFSQAKLSQHSLNELDWVNASERADGELVWMGLQYDRFSGAGTNTDLVLPVARVLKDFSNMNNVGYVLVSLDGKVILEKIKGLKLGETGRFFVVDQTGKVMIDNNLENVNKTIQNDALFHHVVHNNKAEFEFEMNDEPYYGVKQPIENGWTMVGIVPVREITKQLDDVQKLILLSSIGFTALAVVIGLFIAGKMTRPIKQLTTQMKRVEEGNLTARTSIHSSDEIGIMSIQFNQMINRIEQLLEKVRTEQSQKQEAELRALKHRINPHFLFNTLSTIRWLVKFNQNKQADEALTALNRLMEANMGKKGPFITVEEELDFIEKYIDILQIRYDSTFHLLIDVPREVKEFRIPRMLLQPIVENAVFHGIVPTGRAGTISISAHRDSKQVRFDIHDNGSGLTQTKLQKIEQADRSSQLFGIGLKHVYESVQLYFPGGSDVAIKSRQGQGTTVTIILKKQHETGGVDV